MRPDPAIRFWDGDTLHLGDGVTVLRLGGHFPGASVLHLKDGAGGKGALLTGDTLQVVADPCRVTFLWSYPNMIPLSAGTVRRIADALKAWRFERVYGFSAGRQVLEHGRAAVEHSAERYIALLQEDKCQGSPPRTGGLALHRGVGRMHDKVQTRVALVLFATIIFAWGVNWTVTKVLVAHVAPLWTAAIRASVAAAARLGLLVFLGKLVMPKRGDLPVVAAIGICHMAGRSDRLGRTGRDVQPVDLRLG